MAKITGNNQAEADILATHIDPFVDDGNQTTEPVTNTEGVDDATSTSVEGTEEPAAQTTADTNNGATSGRSSNKNIADKGSGQTATPVSTPEEQKSNRAPRRDGAVEDDKGGLKFPDGKYIGPGAQRRLYEDNVNLRTQTQQASTILQRVRDEIIPSYERQLQTLQGELAAYKQVQSLDKQFGLSPTEMSEAVQIAAAYKSNPMQALQYLLARARSEGHNIDGIGGGVDTLAIQQMIDRRLAPLVQDRNTAQEMQRIEQESANQARQFFSKHPDARIHENLIAQAISTNPHLSAESAYYELRLAATQRGLDWAQPLGPQIAMARQQPQTQQQASPVSTVQVPVQTSLPNGRMVSNQVAIKKPLAVHESTSIDDIVRDAMREAGLNM